MYFCIIFFPKCVHLSRSPSIVCIVLVSRHLVHIHKMQNIDKNLKLSYWPKNRRFSTNRGCFIVFMFSYKVLTINNKNLTDKWDKIGTQKEQQTI